MGKLQWPRHTVFQSVCLAPLLVRLLADVTVSLTCAVNQIPAVMTIYSTSVVGIILNEGFLGCVTARPTIHMERKLPSSMITSAGDDTRFSANPEVIYAGTSEVSVDPWERGSLGRYEVPGPLMLGTRQFGAI